MASPCRHTLSTAVVACLLGATAGVGSVPTAVPRAAAANAEFVASQSCPNRWPALREGTDGSADGNVSVLVGGDLSVRGTAAGAEGVVVARGRMAVARDEPGRYEVGTTTVGSQVRPYAGSDVLVVGRSLRGDPGTLLDVGRGIGGDVAVGDYVASGTATTLDGGRLDTGVAAVTAPYDGLLGSLTAMSADYAALPATGLASVTASGLVLTGDGVSDLQVFAVDGATLGAAPDDPSGDPSGVPSGDPSGDPSDNPSGVPSGDPSGDPTDQPAPLPRSLQVNGVPEGATVVVNLIGPRVELDFDALLTFDGTLLDPAADPAFAALTTRLLWNVPGATSVEIGGAAQLPGSLLVPTASSTTTLSGAGTNGRVLVAGDVVHTAGTLHSYPFLPEPKLGCAAPVAHLGTVLLDVRVADSEGVVDHDRVYRGSFRCVLGETDVTPADHTWQARAGGDGKVLSERIPVEAVCRVTQELEDPPGEGWTWAEPQSTPDEVTVAKRDPRRITVTNRPVALPPAPSLPASTPVPDPIATLSPDPGATQAPDPTPAPAEPVPSALPEPSTQPEPDGPSPTPAPEGTATPSTDDGPRADAPREPGPGPLTTTAPLTLRGAFVWGPLLILSLLTMLLRVRRRPRHERRH